MQNIKKNILLLLFLSLLLTTCTGLTKSENPENKDKYPAKLKNWSTNCFAIWKGKPAAIKQHANVTETDWVRNTYGHWGKAGIRHIVNTASAAGIETLWWRANAGGLMMFPTKTHEAAYKKNSYTGYSYIKRDPFHEAARYAHSLNMNVYAWYCPLEESHSIFDGNRSRYANTHPELASKDKDGHSLMVPSFHYEEYQNYKLSIIKELITRWNLDGLVLDLERRGAPWRNERYGYVPEIVNAFKAKTGRNPYEIPENDPEWKKFRAQYFTEFVNKIKKEIESLNRPFNLIIMTTKGRRLAAQENIPVLAQEGLDMLAIMSRGPNGWAWAGDPVEALKNFNDLDIPKMYIMYCYNDKPEALLKKAKDAQQKNINICWFETTPLYRRHNKYWVVAEIALVEKIKALREIQLPDKVENIELRALGLCNWEFKINGEKKAEGDYGEEINTKIELSENPENIKLEFNAERVDKKPANGLAATIRINCENGQTMEINTNEDWKVKSENSNYSPAKLMGKPGAHPFVVTN